jgi:predicted amidohydrolase YtcJ
VIFENCVVRTLDHQLPVARALAIAGDKIAGGVGVHETALPTPDVVDLGGRYVVPGFTATGSVAADDLDTLRARANDLAARGVTCVHDRSGALEVWQDLRARTLLPVRARVFVDGERAEALHAVGIRSGFGDDLVRVIFGAAGDDELDPWSRVRNADDLAAATVDPPQLTGEERRRGRLLPGYAADLVVFEHDPLTLDTNELRELKPHATMLGGRWTHNPPPWT